MSITTDTTTNGDLTVAEAPEALGIALARMSFPDVTRQCPMDSRGPYYFTALSWPTGTVLVRYFYEDGHSVEIVASPNPDRGTRPRPERSEVSLQGSATLYEVVAAIRDARALVRFG